MLADRTYRQHSSRFAGHAAGIYRLMDCTWGSTLGVFIGMLIGTLIKIICCVWMTVSFVQAVW